MACPFLAGWWCDIVLADYFVRAFPLKLVLSVLLCVVMVRQGWIPALVLSPPRASRRLIFVDTVFALTK